MPPFLARNKLEQLYFYHSTCHKVGGSLKWAKTNSSLSKQKRRAVLGYPHSRDAGSYW